MGRGSAFEWVVVGVLVAVHCCSLLASSATLAVGDSQGWTIGPNYTSWAAAHSFVTGDVLFFAYAKGGHNVVQVNNAGYDACSGANATATFTDGNTNVTLTSPGAYYFLCSFPSHCSEGMKLALTVGAATTPAPAPTTSVGTPPPTPAPVPAPTTSPGPSPVSAATPTPTPSPTSTSTPTPTPAPTPLSPSPASTPTPVSSPPPPPSASTPSATGGPPPSAAPSLLSSASLAAVFLCISAAFLAL